MNVSVETPATDEEAAAIVAAIEAFWPRPVVVLPEAAKRPSAWRFSGHRTRSSLVLRPHPGRSRVAGVS